MSGSVPSALYVKVAFTGMADHRAPMKFLPRSQVLRVAVALLVLAVVGAAIGIGVAVGSFSSIPRPPATGVHPQATSVYDRSLPEVESCTGEPGAVVLRPTGIGSDSMRTFRDRLDLVDADLGQRNRDLPRGYVRTRLRHRCVQEVQGLDLPLRSRRVVGPRGL